MIGGDAMITGGVGTLGKFRLWLEDRPEVRCSLGDPQVVELQCNPHAHSQPGSKTLILEVMIPRGARVLYGLLGAVYAPSEGNGVLRVRSPKSFPHSLVVDSLIQGFEPAIVDLLPEYLDASLAGIKRALKEGARIYPGTLDLVYCASGEASSNPLLFEKMGFVLMNLLTLGINEDANQAINRWLGV